MRLAKRNFVIIATTVFFMGIALRAHADKTADDQATGDGKSYSDDE